MKYYLFAIMLIAVVVTGCVNYDRFSDGIVIISGQNLTQGIDEEKTYILDGRAYKTSLGIALPGMPAPSDNDAPLPRRITASFDINGKSTSLLHIGENHTLGDGTVLTIHGISEGQKQVTFRD